jgi:hypothetical protein
LHFSVTSAAYEGKPDSLELQGDHGAVRFRNMVLAPLTKQAK